VNKPALRKRQAAKQELERLVRLALRLMLLGGALVVLVAGYLGWRVLR
jgi:type VI protein secretion system component VasF